MPERRVRPFRGGRALITDVPGILIGSFTDPDGLTGCTVVLCPPGTVGSGEVRGGAPGTRETDLLRPGMLVQEVNAVLLAGGSAFGLAAAEGVVRFLEERGVGFDAGVARVPIVPAAVLFDLAVGDPRARPTADDAHRACLEAGTQVAQGNVGAGTGATVAKQNGLDGAVKGGLGTAAAVDGELIVGALAAVNAYGEILDERGEVLARSRTEAADAEAAGAAEAAEAPDGPGAPPQAETLPGMNTTLVVVATNARLSRERAHLVALAGHAGLASTIRPAHTILDGDTVFSLATGETEAPQRVIEGLAEQVTADAIRSAIRHAASVPGAPSVEELGT
ncbi:MAG: P1 family peptidase [Actinomycetota bacterium]